MSHFEPMIPTMSITPLPHGGRQLLCILDKITPMNNKDVWSKGSGNQWIKYFQAATTKTDLNLSVEQHHKHNQSNKDKQ